MTSKFDTELHRKTKVHQKISEIQEHAIWDETGMNGNCLSEA